MTFAFDLLSHLAERSPKTADGKANTVCLLHNAVQQLRGQDKQCCENFQPGTESRENKRVLQPLTEGEKFILFFFFFFKQ